MKYITMYYCNLDAGNVEYRASNTSKRVCNFVLGGNGRDLPSGPQPESGHMHNRIINMRQ